MSDTDRIEEFRSHWWWRPGWGVGTRYYAWHLTFANQPAMRHLVATYQAVLSTFPALDAVPPQWLHLTTQGVGHVAEVAAGDRDRMIAAVRARLATARPAMAVFGPADITHEGVELSPVDREPLRAVQRAIREGMTDVFGAAAVPGIGDIFWPHVSLAYANRVAPTAPVRAALAELEPSPVEVPFSQASLIELHRDNGVYEWTLVATAPIGAG